MQPETPSDRTTKPDVDAQRAETGVAGTVGPSASALPNSMSRGLWRGGAIGAVVGAVVLGPLALIPIYDLDVGVRVLIALVVGVAAGAAVGSVFFGGAVAESENEENDGDERLVPDKMHRPDTRPGSGRETGS